MAFNIPSNHSIPKTNAALTELNSNPSIWHVFERGPYCLHCLFYLLKSMKVMDSSTSWLQVMVKYPTTNLPSIWSSPESGVFGQILSFFCVLSYVKCGGDCRAIWKGLNMTSVDVSIWRRRRRNSKWEALVFMFPWRKWLPLSHFPGPASGFGLDFPLI